MDSQKTEYLSVGVYTPDAGKLSQTLNVRVPDLDTLIEAVLDRERPVVNVHVPAVEQQAPQVHIAAPKVEVHPTFHHTYNLPRVEIPKIEVKPANAHVVLPPIPEVFRVHLEPFHLKLLPFQAGLSHESECFVRETVKAAYRQMLLLIVTGSATYAILDSLLRMYFPR